MNIDELSGRELDWVIAERVFDWSDFWESPDGKYLLGYSPAERSMGIESERSWVPAYSANIASAWEVVEALRARGWGINLSDDGQSPWHVSLMRFNDDPAATDDRDEVVVVSVHAEAVPLAICRAALRAVAL